MVCIRVKRPALPADSWLLSDMSTAVLRAREVGHDEARDDYGAVVTPGLVGGDGEDEVEEVGVDAGLDGVGHKIWRAEQ